MATNITGNHDGKGGRNESYKISGRGNVSRKRLIKEVKQGKHPNFTTYKIGKEVFIRSKPDDTKKNNVNK